MKSFLKKIIRWLKSPKPYNSILIRSELRAQVYRSETDEWEDYGIVATRCVTTVAVNYLANSFVNSTSYPADVFKYHASGTGSTAESIGQTALVTEVETREEGTQVISESGDNIYQTVATHTYGSSRTIWEHGLFDQLASGGKLWDRSKLTTSISVVSGDKITWTYNLTIAAGY